MLLNEILNSVIPLNTYTNILNHCIRVKDKFIFMEL